MDTKGTKESKVKTSAKKTTGETKLLKSAVTPKIAKNDTKKITVSKTRAKKDKFALNVKDAENTLLLKLKDGEVVIEMLPEVAPNHVERIKELVRSGFYNGLKFHRVIEKFMAQTGCPYGTGTGGTGKKLKAEFSKTPHKRGTVSMARSMDINSGDSQFFICFENCEWLDGQYTVWGNVISGMEFVDKIKLGSGGSGVVSNPDEIISLTVVADL